MTLLFVVLGYVVFLACLAGLLTWALDLDEPPNFLVNRVSREPVPPYEYRGGEVYTGPDRRAKVIN